MTEDRLGHVKAVATFGSRDTAEWRCECGAAWPCDATVLREAGERLAIALFALRGDIHAGPPHPIGGWARCPDCAAAKAALAAWKEVTDG